MLRNYQIKRRIEERKNLANQKLCFLLVSGCLWIHTGWSSWISLGHKRRGARSTIRGWCLDVSVQTQQLPLVMCSVIQKEVNGPPNISERCIIIIPGAGRVRSGMRLMKTPIKYYVCKTWPSNYHELDNCLHLGRMGTLCDLWVSTLIYIHTQGVSVCVCAYAGVCAWTSSLSMHVYICFSLMRWIKLYSITASRIQPVLYSAYTSLTATLTYGAHHKLMCIQRKIFGLVCEVGGGE